MSVLGRVREQGVSAMSMPDGVRVQRIGAMSILIGVRVQEGQCNVDAEWSESAGGSVQCGC